MLNVETVVRNRYPQLLDQRPLVGRSVVTLLRHLFRESEFRQFEADYPHLSGLDFVEQVLEYFRFDYKVSQRELERIPTSGRVVIIANHPIGSLDGLMLLKLLSSVRRDVKVVANELLMNIRPLQPLLLPVDNINGGTARENLETIDRFLHDDGALIIFPSGEVSRIRPTGVRDTKWHTGFLRIASRAQAPVLPMFVGGRNSSLFYGVSMLCKPLSTLLLVQEMFKQAQKTVTVRIGEQIPYASYCGTQLPLVTRVQLFRRHLYRIGAGKRPVLATQSPVARPEPRLVLRRAVQNCERLGQTPDQKQILLYETAGSCPLMREIGRLREVAFRAVGEGTGRRLDMDAYDQRYQHIVLWDENDLEVVGAYRLVHAGQTVAKDIRNLYTHSLFQYGDAMRPYLMDGLELGRSFVQPRYWGKRSLDYLWMGIGAYLSRYPARYLFGPVSISSQMPPRARDLMIEFYRLYFGFDQPLARSRNPYQNTDALDQPPAFSGQDYSADFKTLKAMLANMGSAVPTLYKQYTELCEPGGVKFLDFGIDPAFSNCIDGLVLVDLDRLKPKRRKRYLSAGESL
ncbi:MAG: acyltransferase [Lysobacteraceae bacterium]|nr:MAG: acyltransferase [Xanthomonadaceae bacterium]